MLAIVVAGCLFWVAAAIVLPRWDGSLVTLDADVVSTTSVGSGKGRIDYTTVRFVAPDGRTVISTIHNASVESGATTVRIRYDPLNPKKAMLDSSSTPYWGAMTILIGAGFFLWLAHAASLRDWPAARSRSAS